MNDDTNQAAHEPAEQHVREATTDELADEQKVAEVMSQDADAAADDDDRQAVDVDSRGDAAGGTATTTADPGRTDPIVPGEGRL